ncbi:MAG TPA: hypothetical protein P5561_01205 [Candidatus Omnitrophota bacterium]|nr:hypothetical protein [Candidatus Omnitrophota bacterium]HRY85131.1 hypothetical protein [Candidatus Omnitrophota bacterium]
MKRVLTIVTILFWRMGTVCGAENEVLQESGAKVFVREHPQTGQSFVSLRTEGKEGRDLFKGFTRREIRPDYKMLDPKTKSGEIPYEGPVSDRTKVYVFAATIATLGVAGSAVAAAAFPASAAAAASSGGGAVLGTGAAVVAGVAADIVVESHIAPGEENYIHEGKTESATGSPKKLSFQEIIREQDALGPKENMI